MKCEGCGNEYPSKLTGCTYCGEPNPERPQSKLIEFPGKARLAQAETPARTPAWKQELNERLRAVREKRGIAGPSTAPLKEPALEPSEGQSAARPTARDAEAVTRPIYPRGGSYRPPRARPVVRRPAASPSAEAPTRSGPAGAAVKPKMEAAPPRPRREEQISAAPLPIPEPYYAYPSKPAAPLALDREATARALEPETDARPQAAPVAESVVAESERVVTRPVQEVSQPANDYETLAEPDLRAIDEIEPKDYLEEEVRRVDKALHDEFAQEEGVSIAAHFVINLVDAMTVALAAMPFLAVAQLAVGDIAVRPGRFALGLVVLLVAVFYLALTQSLAGKTFGMMLTNTRVVDALTHAPITPPRALLRTLGYLIAVAPAMLGILWTATNRRRRGWQDFISSTVVTPDL